MVKFAIACLLTVFVTTPVFAAAEKPHKKFDLATCRKLAMEKVYIDNGRALNRAVLPAVRRCMHHGPSAI